MRSTNTMSIIDLTGGRNALQIGFTALDPDDESGVKGDLGSGFGITRLTGSRRDATAPNPFSPDAIAHSADESADEWVALSTLTPRLVSPVEIGARITGGLIERFSAPAPQAATALVAYLRWAAAPETFGDDLFESRNVSGAVLRTAKRCLNRRDVGAKTHRELAKLAPAFLAAGGHSAKFGKQLNTLLAETTPTPTRGGKNQRRRPHRR
jgi:hypothetical protein